MNKILGHKYFARIHRFAQQMLIHIGDSLFAQFRALTQAIRTPLKLWSAAFQQYSAEHTHAVRITLCLLCANIKYQVDLTYFITPFGCPAMQTFIKSGFIQVKHAFPLIHLANSFCPARISLSFVV